jgi:hypothetical protein
MASLTSMLERWKSDLDRILTAAGRHDPSSIVKEISDLGATMGEDVGEALLDGHPELLKHAPAVTRVFNQMVIDRSFFHNFYVNIPTTTFFFFNFRFFLVRTK